MSVRAEWTPQGACVVEMYAEGVSWSGEVGRDMVMRVIDGLERCIAIAAQYEFELTDEGDDDTA
jgi:hypothetical protein